ncbi:MAG: ABC transporter permease [Clostridiales bacterium]|nr:ABC transporter permease [Clostridiales bacterium]
MRKKYLAIPYVVWMAIFVIAPLCLVVGYALINREGQLTLENFQTLTQYWTVFATSFRLAIIATAVCLLIGYPIAYWISREGPGVKRIAMIAMMLPMWMNFLLRTYAWMSLLENTGIINTILANLGVFRLINAVFGTELTYFPMINTPGAVVLGMVYNYLPFMILPIYTVIDKIDMRVIEAAEDLGANGVQVFRKIIFPLSLPGVLSGITMVFIPSVSTFAISKLLGGGMTLLLGDLIEMQFYGNAYNPYLGSAISLVMMVIVLICMAVMNHFGEGEEGVVYF